MKTTLYAHIARSGLVGTLFLLWSLAASAQSESYEDFYGEGDEMVELAVFEVTAEPEEDWVIEYDDVWDTMLEVDMWEDVDQGLWDDFIDSLDDDVDWNQVDCGAAKAKALLAQGAYSGNSVGNNQALNNNAQALQSHGINASQLSNSNGFQAVVYQNTVTGTITVAFGGTNGLNDWGPNIGQGFGMETEQYNMAMQLATAITTANPTSQIEFVGHSLGGGLASAAGLVTGRATATFNAAGLHSSTTYAYDQTTLANANSLIDAYYVGGEILSSAQDSSPLPNAAGERHRLAPASGLNWNEPVEKHDIQSVINSFPC
ncbi:MAG: hypothetical protein ACREIA_07435 [Opitutaceae bacterium]